MYKMLFDIYGNIPSLSTKSRIYSFLPSVCRYCLRKAQSFVMKQKKVNTHYLSNTENVNQEIVVSLTSFPKRLDTLWLTIESLKRQSIVPLKIVLYLINEEVTVDQLPKSLVAEIDDLFEIRFRDGKLRAHGKYHFAMKDFPDSCIVTVDDDMIYPYDTIEALWQAHLLYPDCVITNNTHQVVLENNIVKSYAEWNAFYKSDKIIDKPCLIPMGVGGALYPPYILYKDTLNFELAKSMSYLADDLWLYAMTKLAGRRVVKSKFNFLRIMPIDISDNITLTGTNNGECQNDVQFNNVRNYYLKELNIDIAK